MNIHFAARSVLAECVIEAKLAETARLRSEWESGAFGSEGDFGAPLANAGIPERPLLASPASMPRRQLNGPENHAALIHALAHIEFNAINLALDAVQRFAGLPREFYGDWLVVAAEEAYHFGLLRNHLRGLGKDYGDFPAHAGLWEMAEKTAHDPLARMALVPRLLEARGLDVTPGMIGIFRKAGDAQALDALSVIYAEEVAHVAYGSKWFHFLCGRQDIDPKDVFHDLLRRYFHGALKPPFNEEKRAEAGIPPDFYWPLADQTALQTGD